MDNDMTRRVVAEFFGTLWLVLGGCGAAVLAAGFPALGIGFLGVGLAFRLTVLTMAYAVGHISGGHFNPAVTIGLWCAGRCASRHVLPYVIVQVVGGVLASGALWIIASGKPDWIAGGEYVGQLWLFWVAPIAGAMIAGALARVFYEPSAIVETVVVEERRVA